jgi:4-hydroxy-tetrahydrodipicolinate synthase
MPGSDPGEGRAAMKGKSKFGLKGKPGIFIPEGMITALVTPFDSKGELDEPALQKLAEWQINAGMDGLMIPGGCGEFVNLNDGERRRTVEVAVKAAAGRVPVIAGVLAANTRHAVELTQQAKAAGAAAALVLTPYYINPSDEGIYRHFAAIAEKTSLPILLYNNPGRTKIDMGVELLDRLADIPTVVGIKECQRDIGLISERLQAVGDRISYLAGDDDLTVPMYPFGCRGDIGITQLIAPQPQVELWAALKRGDWERAVDVHLNFVLPIFSAIMTRNHPAPIKRMMALAGHPVGEARLPLVAPAAEQEGKIRKVLVDIARFL